VAKTSIFHGGFTYVFIFTPKIGEMIQFDEYGKKWVETFHQLAAAILVIVNCSPG